MTRVVAASIWPSCSAVLSIAACWGNPEDVCVGVCDRVPERDGVTLGVTEKLGVSVTLAETVPLSEGVRDGV